jgi:hypothetical protein
MLKDPRIDKLTALAEKVEDQPSLTKTLSSFLKIGLAIFVEP